MYIYLITNLINNKKYIGQTSKTIDIRWKQHINSMNATSKKYRHLYSSMVKYGIDNFKIEALGKYETRSELNKAECFFISVYKTTNSSLGYNKSIGGQYNTISFEGRLSISKKAKERWKNPEYKKTVSLKISKSKIGKPNISNIGKSLSAEQKEKISRNRKGKMCGIFNHNFNKPGFMLNKKFSEEHKKKISIALKNNKNGRNKAKPILCIETNEIFKNITELRKKYPKGNIYKAIKNKTTSNQLHWKFLFN